MPPFSNRNFSDETLSHNGSHYQANFHTKTYAVKTDATYKATVYVGNKAVCEKEFQVLEHGNRSNAPNK